MKFSGGAVMSVALPRTVKNNCKSEPPVDIHCSVCLSVRVTG